MRQDSRSREPRGGGGGAVALRVLHHGGTEGDAALVRSALRRSNHARFDVVQVTALDDALAEASSGAFDVLLVDLDCPGRGDETSLDALGRVSGAALVVYSQADETDPKLLHEGAEDVLLHRDLASALLGRVLCHAVHRYGVHSQLEASASKLREELEVTRRNQELEQRLVLADRLASVGLLAAGVAHEINNPLTYVQLNLSWLLDRINALEGVIDDPLLDEMRLTLTENQEGMDHIRSVVRDLSSFARAGGDKLQELDLTHVVRSACNLVRNELRHRARLVLELEPVPAIVGERSKLIQLVVNLLVNAAHAVEEGAAHENTVTVRTGQTDDGIGLVVEDSGCGIAAEDLTRIFEPFYTTRGQGRGTGLGLSLCAETARRHNGSLEVSSTLGRGSRFTLLLPRDTGLAASLPSGPQRPLDPDVALRVLVVDDEEHVGTALARAMAPMHRVVVARDGGDALRLLAVDSAFDAILCDVMMPVVDGPRLHAVLTEDYPHLVGRMVFMTGEAFTPRARAFVSAVPNRVLPKPTSIEAVIEALIKAAGTPAPSGW